jgi:hypothetical protein
MVGQQGQQRLNEGRGGGGNGVERLVLSETFDVEPLNRDTHGQF